MENEIQQLLSTKTASSKDKLLIQIVELIGKLSDNMGELYKLHSAQAQRLNALDNEIRHIDSELSDLYEEVMELQSTTGAAQC
jgi:archaellum component FlaC